MIHSVSQIAANAAREYKMPARKFTDSLKKHDGVQARGKMDGTWYRDCSNRISSAISRNLSRLLETLDLALGCGRREALTLR